MTTTKSTREIISSVESFLLQRHRGILIRAAAAVISNRILLAANAAFLIFMNHLSFIQLAGSALAAILISLLWHYEMKAMNIDLRNIEEKLAKRSGDEWEDTYIKLRYDPPGYKLQKTYLRLEPFLWLLVIGTLIVLRIFIPNTPA